MIAKVGRIGSLVTAFTMVAMLGVALLPRPAYADPGPAWWNTDWQYRMLIEITESSGSPLTNYQVPIALDTATFDYSKAKANGDDLRFISSGTECDYWIENWNATGESKLWVEVPSIPASGTTTIYMYYGNSGAGAASNGTNTFDFFDDFPGASVDTGKWNVMHSSYVSVSGGNLELTGGGSVDTDGGIWTTDNFGTSYVVTMRAYLNEGWPAFAWFVQATNQGYAEWIYPADDLGYLYKITFGEPSSSVYLGTGGTNAYAYNRWSIIEIKINGTNYDLYQDGYLRSSYSHSDLSGGGIGLEQWENGPSKYDWILVRKYASSEPTVNMGQEESSASWMDYFGSTAAISASTNVTVSDGSVQLLPGIEFDAVSTASGGGSNTLSWSHTIGSGSNRILVVTSAAEGDDATEHIITGITYNGQSLTKAVSHVVGAGTYKASSEIWHLVEANLPSAGSYTVEISFTASTRGYSAGAISLKNVKQSAPEATNTNDDGEAGASSITTSVTTQTNYAWVVDVVASGNTVSFATSETGQTERWDRTGTSMAGAGSTKEVATASPTDMGWTTSGSNRLSHVVAAFAPIASGTSGNLKSTAITPSSLTSWDKFYANHTLPAGTGITYKILNAADDSVLCTITAAQAAAGHSISSCAGSTSSIKLYGELSTTDTAYTPKLKDWKVTWFSTSAPTVDAVALYQSDESTLINPGGSIDPQVEYAVKVTVGDAGTLDDISEVKITIFYDSAGTDPAAPGISDTQTCAIITWIKGSGWAIDPSASTTWVLVTGSCKTPTMSATTGDWWAHFKPGKVATESGAADDWDIYAKATDAGANSGDLYARDYEMNWYGEITVNTASVDWGTVALGSDFAANEQTGISVTYLANGAYNQQVKASNPWVAPPNQVTLNEAGTPGPGEFSLKAGNGGTPFYDDFEEHNVGDTPDGWSLSLGSGSGTLSVQEEATNKVMDYTHVVDGDPHITAGHTSWTDYTYEAKMRIVTGNSHHGLLFRSGDRNNTCYCGVSDPTNGIVQLWKRIGGTWTQIGGDWSITPPGNTWHDWKVVVNGTNIKVYWDGAYLGEGDLGSGELTSGKIGCFAGYEGQTRYDDFKVHSSKVLVLTADYTTFHTGTQTGENGNTESSNTLWLKLGPSGIPDVTYSGTIYYRIAQ